jgi:transglutaminase-like putative cysteine protease
MAQLTTRRDSRRRPPRRVPTTLLRIVLVGAMCEVLAVAAGRAFDDLVWPLLATPPVVTAAGLLCYRRRPIERVGVLVAGILAGTLLAGILTGAGPDELVTGPFTGVKRLLTGEWPSPLDPRIVVAVAFMLAIVTAAAVELAGRPQLHLAPLVAVIAGFTGAMAISAPVHPTLATSAALGVMALVLMMLRPGDDARARARTLGADRPLLLVIAAIGVSAALITGAIAWSDRSDPRANKAAEATATLLDPVEETVALRDADPPIDLFQVTDRSTLIGPALPARWRLQALAVYDGQRWTPGLTVRPIGTTLGLNRAARPDIAPPVQFDVELRSDDIDLVPLPGEPLSVDTGSSMGVETDVDRTVVRLTEPPRSGLTISASAEVAPGPAASRLATVATRQVDEIARGFTQTATEMAGDGTVLEQLQLIETTMQDEWDLDNDAPGSGQQLNLIQRFVETTHRGTQEQFVTAFVLLARSLGVEARVATGFVVPPEELDAPLELWSNHAKVWPEVKLVGQGWLAFDPAPAQETGDDEPTPPPPAAQSPAAVQPPIAPPADRAGEEQPVTPTEPPATSNWETVRTWLVRSSVVAGLAVLPFLVAVGGILGMKWSRRRQRLRAHDPARRITGAWANTTDSLVDAGLTIGPAWTNDRIAEEGTVVAPTAPYEMRRLASTASAITFGEEPDERLRVDDAVATARTVDLAILADRSRWQRIRWRLSLRSLRRTTRSPVIA